MSLPLPPGRPGHLDLRGEANLSLLFDQGFSGYAEDWVSEPAKEAKQKFLESFCTTFHPDNPPSSQSAETPGKHYLDFHKRRAEALDKLGAECFTYYNHTPLVLGLGLPSPVENGFLFDPLTGSPYLPGSSLKGLARAAALLASRGELLIEPTPEREEEPTEFWRQHHNRVFGPDTSVTAKAKGRLTFFDAFPSRLPKLRVEILTPHHTCHFGNEPKPPADWQDPIPVPFLAICPGEQFDIRVRSLERDEAQRRQDLAQLHALLTEALDLLAVGAKTSSGYGFLSHEKLMVEPAIEANVPGKKSNDPPPLPPPPQVSTRTLTNVKIGRDGQRIVAFTGQNPPPKGRAKLVPQKIFKLLGKKQLVATVQLITVNGQTRIEGIQIND